MEEPIATRYVFVMLLAMCDQRGDIVGADAALARRLNMPLEDFRAAIERLGRPDPDSGLQAEEGRRVVRTGHAGGETRGLRVVNYEYYRGLQRERDRRDYMREYMAKRRSRSRSRGAREREELAGAQAAQGVLLRQEREARA